MTSWNLCHGNMNEDRLVSVCVTYEVCDTLVWHHHEKCNRDAEKCETKCFQWTWKHYCCCIRSEWSCSHRNMCGFSQCNLEGFIPCGVSAKKRLLALWGKCRAVLIRWEQRIPLFGLMEWGLEGLLLPTNTSGEVNMGSWGEDSLDGTAQGISSCPAFI